MSVPASTTHPAVALPSPSVRLLLDDREEARELADALAAQLHAVLTHDAVLNVDRELLHAAEQTLQEWFERSWATNEQIGVAS